MQSAGWWGGLRLSTRTEDESREAANKRRFCARKTAKLETRVRTISSEPCAPRSAPWLSVLLALGVGCAQPTDELRPHYSKPPPAPIAKDAGFMPSDDDESGDGDQALRGDADASSAQERPGDAGSAHDAATEGGRDAEVPLPDAGPLDCQGSTLQCGARCVDVSTSAANCGVCDHKCPGGAACTGGTCASPSADCTYQQRDGHDYLFCTKQSTWKDARAACKNFGLDLVVIDDQAENDFVEGQDGRWIGLVNKGKDPFHWIVPGAGDSGPVASFTNWDKGEPNNDDDCLIPIPGIPLVCTYEDCAEIKSNGKWNDAQCDKSNTTRDYVCESY